MKVTTRRCVLVLALVACAAVVGACRTVQGLGQDVTNAGKAGERAIDRASD